MKLKLLLLFIVLSIFTGYSYPDLKSVLDAQAGQSVIDIPYGIYEMNTASGTHYTFSGLKNVTVNGNGSLIICKTPARAFYVTNCENFTIKDLTIDYDPLCFTQGTITQVSADCKSWTVRIHDGYATSNISISTKILLYDGVTKLVKKNLFNIHGSNYILTQSTSDPALLNFTITRSMLANSVSVGEYVVMSLNTPAGMDTHTMYITSCKNFAAKNITIYGSNMFSMIEHDCDNSLYLNCVITRNPNDPTKSVPRLRSGNGDGIHSKHAVRGPRVENCTVGFNGDDCIAINGRFYPVYKVDEANKYIYILSSEGGLVRIFPEDNVVCVDNNGSVKATLSATEIIPQTPTSEEKTNCTSQFKSLVSAGSLTYGSRIKIINWPIAGIKTGDYVYSENRIGGGFQVLNNSVGHNPGRGILIKSSNGVIKNNTVEGSQLSGIVLSPEVNWMEAGCSNNVEISNNTIRNCIFASSHPGMTQPAALCVISLNAANQLSPNGAHNNISIFKNRIEDCPRPGVVVTSTKGLYYHHNTIIPNASITRTHGATFGVSNTVDFWTANIADLSTATSVSIVESTTPTLKATAGSTAYDTITINGMNLISDIYLTLSGTDSGLFSVSPSVISPVAGKVDSAKVVIAYSPDKLGSHSAVLHINSTDAAEITHNITGSFDLSDYVGKPLPGWTDGQLDIYQINTGRGENYFMVLPDSTSMLMDVGDINVDQYSNPQRPDTTRSAGEWVARFVQRVNPKLANVDYVYNTHFHSDHFGSYLVKNAVLSTDKGALNYKPTGISRVGDFLNIKKFVDRGYPNYNQPQNISTYQDIANYSKFVKWKVQTANSEAEKFIVGSNTQFRLNYKPTDYPEFKIQNLFANGQVWTGSGLNVIDFVAKNPDNLISIIDENTLSCGIRLHYGKFRFYAGGDIYNKLKNESGVAVDMEVAVKDIIGEVDVCKTNHHCFTGSMIPEFTNTVSANLYLLPYINSKHLKTTVLGNLFANPKSGSTCMAVPTYLSDVQKTSLAPLSYNNQITQTGHAVIRVAKGGDTYMLYMLDDTSENNNVIAVYGPFSSKMTTDVTTTIVDAFKNIDIQIFDKNRFRIACVGEIDRNASVEVYDLFGRMILQKKLADTVTEFTLPDKVLVCVLLIKNGLNITRKKISLY